jgi:hypothetical protein
MATVFLQLANGAEFQLQKPESELGATGAGSRLAVSWDVADAFVLPESS